jgi:hypothetical protein
MFINYLSLLNAVLLTDICVIFLSIFGIIKSRVLREEWYPNYNISAVIADVLIIVLVIILSKIIYPFLFGNRENLILFICLAVIIQIIHDLAFYYLFSVIPKGQNKMLDTFKSYARENGYKAVFSDSIMIVSSCLLYSYFSTFTLDQNVILLIVLIYLVPYLVYN